MFQRILVAVDLSDASAQALADARALRDATGANLALVHVLPDYADLRTLEASGYVGTLPAMADLLEKAREKIRSWSSVAEREDFELFLEQGAAATRIVERAESWGADLVVLGSEGQNRLAEALLGSVAKRVVHNAHCPVLVCRPGSRSGVILAATDLSDPSLPAITRAASEAHRRGARLSVVHVVDPSAAQYAASAGGMFGLTVALPPPELRSDVRDALVQTMRQALQRLGATGEAIVLYGKPAETILQVAKELDASLVVVGTHGRTGFLRIALGSVADSVVRHAHCSVLVVRHARGT